VGDEKVNTPLPLEWDEVADCDPAAFTAATAPARFAECGDASAGYAYSFSKELMQEWDWKEHFSPQPDTLAYLNYVADKFDLRRDIQCRSTVAAAHWDEAANRWSVTLESGELATAQFLFTAIGILSAYTLLPLLARRPAGDRRGCR
jgi:hypothetical protein